MSLLGLGMIVKDESESVGRALEYYRSTVSQVTVEDTGSRYGTQDVVRRSLAGGVVGDLYEEPFVDFSTSRNRALDLHGQATLFVLVVNVDLLCGAMAIGLEHGVRASSARPEDERLRDNLAFYRS